MTEPESNPPRIIVDDDWKARAQAEKEQLQQQKQAPSPPSSEPQRAQGKPDASAPPLPPASFSLLVTTLATQAVAMMGQVPGPDGQPVMELAEAKHFIDTLGVLEEKTQGNLTLEEAALLKSVLHELRLLFVSVGKQIVAEQQPK